jgi:hypothetical protein
MRTMATVGDRLMGYLGLFLIGAISWVADRTGPSRLPARPAPGVPSRISLAAHRSR